MIDINKVLAEIDELPESMSQKSISQSAAIRAAQAKPDVRARQRVAVAAANARPDVRARQKVAQARPDVKARQSAAIKEAKARPGVRERKGIKLSEANEAKRSVHYPAIEEAMKMPIYKKDGSINANAMVMRDNLNARAFARWLDKCRD